MTLTVRAKRAFALLLALAVVVTGLTLSPLGAAPANAVSNSSATSKVLKSINALRTKNGLPKLLVNGFVKEYNAQYTAGIAKKGSINATVKPKTKIPADPGTGAAPAGGTLTAYAKNGTENSRISRLIKLYKTKGKSSILGDYNYGSVSVVRKGKSTYTSLTLYKYTATPPGRMVGATPKISGHPRVGRTLKAVVGTFKPKATAYSYAWYANGKLFATSYTIKLASAQKGKKITLRVTGTRDGYKTPVAKTSKATVKVK